VSHLPQRKEKNCLNCVTTVVGKYCHLCGQENVEPKESVWHLISHFFNDITHFDGKFFGSFKDLLLSIFFYVYKAMRSFYERKRAKTILKYYMLLFSFLITGAIFMLIFFFISIFKI